MVAAASTITDEREQVVDFSVPYFNSLQSLTVNTQETPTSPARTSSARATSSRRRRARRGSSGPQENLVPQGVDLKTFQSATDMFRDLEAERRRRHQRQASVGGIIVDLPSPAVVQDIDTDEHYGFAFSPSNPELREAMNAASHRSSRTARTRRSTASTSRRTRSRRSSSRRPDPVEGQEGSARRRAAPSSRRCEMAIAESPTVEPTSPRTSGVRRPRCRRRSSPWGSRRSWSSQPGSCSRRSLRALGPRAYPELYRRGDLARDNGAIGVCNIVEALRTRT